MKGLRPIWMVARRELRERFKSRTYRITTVILLLIVLGAIVIPQMVGDGDGTTYDLGLVGDTSSGLAGHARGVWQPLQTFASTRRRSMTLPQLRPALEAGDVDAVLVGGTGVCHERTGRLSGSS